MRAFVRPRRCARVEKARSSAGMISLTRMLKEKEEESA